ncbi:PIN-like domain-containing protein [Ruegeria sp. HKCCA4812]|uniref:PIN-like domain-containing protein n=1 Tax=Ruegeria sp. HKCCA4812 TaxID=2682993 RepID=UPI0014883216|nr:PIN-like domain-containing protein [Ruegeria sp. HKCCA4812]
MINGASQCADEIVERMIAVFDRQIEIPALGALVSALRVSSATASLENAAIAIDANAVLRIPQHRKSSDIVDYLSTQHSGPTILPGQVIQEYWNNQLAAVDTVSKGMQKKYDSFKTEVGRYNQTQGDAFLKISEGLEAFKDDNSELFHPDTVHKTLTFLETLSEKAVVPYAPRQVFHQIAEQRKRVKTPPGFRDDGDGDFYVWVDVLFGLSKMMKDGVTPSRLILVTNDGKIDWCREGEAHPVLCAEVKALLGIEFEIWTLDKFSQAVTG